MSAHALSRLKFLRADGTTPFACVRLPIGGWLPAIEGPLAICKRGYHFTTPEHAVEWIDDRCHPVEVRGDVVEDGTKWCAREMLIHPPLDTWNERSQRLFAADCAERVLPIFERKHPGDDRPRKAIVAARAFARGEIDAAAWAAARDAARAAAWAAARDAARAAAWDAARAAARDAARAATGAAARDAARAATGAATGDAARDAECEWQSARLMEYLRGEVDA